MLCTEGQPFAGNYNPSYAAGGLLGHTGQDWSCGFGTPITSRFDGYVYKTLTKEHPAADGSGFTGVFMIVDDGIECFEWLVGHCNPTVQAGTTVKKGDIIATEANHGLVYAGNVQISLAMQAAGDQRGSHRHYQKRPIFKTPTLRGSALSIEGGGMYRDPDGSYYQVWAYNNGFNGCVDPTRPVFGRDLWYGASGYDVFVLQRFMQRQGLFAAQPTGYFGPVTAQAVLAFQRAHGIQPLLGYFGPKTRSLINIPVPDLSGT